MPKKKSVKKDEAIAPTGVAIAVEDDKPAKESKEKVGKKEKKEDFQYKHRESKARVFAVTKAGKYIPVDVNRTVVVEADSELGTSKMKTLAEAL
jgi:hypothetical protein